MKLLDGRIVSKDYFMVLKNKVFNLVKKPVVAIIQIGNDNNGILYVRELEKKIIYLGYGFKYINYDLSIKEDDIINGIEELNIDNNIDGILLVLPIPNIYDKDRIINSIDSNKDIDGITDININKLKNNEEGFISATSLAIMDIFKYYNINIHNKKIVIIGKSRTVGLPISILMKRYSRDVFVIDSKTKDINYLTRDADIIIIAIGKSNFLKRDNIKEGVIIIDVGINNDNGDIVGDVDFDDVLDKVDYITPVPNGIGPMTIYEVMNNLYINKERK